MNSRIASIAPSATLGITSRAKAMAAAGGKVYNFAAGEPDFDTPDHIKAEAERNLRAGRTKYTPEAGLPELGAAIAEKLARENSLQYKPQQIIVSNGAKHSLFNVVMTLCGEGDEIIIPAPYWLSYPEMVKAVGGRPVFVRGREENRFKIKPEELESVITGNSRAVVVNSPSNPTGLVYSADELRDIAEVAVHNDLYIISDEIYEKMTYDGATHVSIGSLSKKIFDRTITVNGFSKTYSMTGWRLGYCAGPEDVIRPMAAFQGHSTSAPNTFAQYGAIEALRGSQDCVSRMVRTFAERRTCLYERLDSLDGVSCLKPMGAFYMFPNISSYGLDSVSFAERLLAEQKVALIPGAPFGADENVRLSYACSMETIREGMDALERFLATL